MMVRNAINGIHILILVLCVLVSSAQKVSSPPSGGGGVRRDVSLNDSWVSVVNDSNQHAYDGFEEPAFKTTGWQPVNVPHNWDAYEGYRRLQHGNRHGYAWYRRTFAIAKKENNKAITTMHIKSLFIANLPSKKLKANICLIT